MNAVNIGVDMVNWPHTVNAVNISVNRSTSSPTVNTVNISAGWKGHYEKGHAVNHAVNAVNISANRSYNPAHYEHCECCEY